MSLVLNKVARFYGSRLIFKDVSLECPPGSITLLTGPNGAGKSTLIKIMAGLLQPSSGDVRLDDIDGNAVIGYLGHRTLNYPNLTALENLSFWASMHGKKTSKEELFAVLEKVGLRQFAEEKAGEFSRGMGQRLSLARLILLRPDVLLLDEPGTGLDAESQKLLREVTIASAKAGTIVVYITHSLETDLPIATQIAEIKKRTLSLKSSAEIEIAQKLPQEHTGQPGILSSALQIARKDILLSLRRGTGLLQAMLLGLLLIFMFSLSLVPGQYVTPQGAATIFWMSSLFCQVLIFSSLYGYEENNDQRHGLVLTPAPVQSVWLGKALAGGILLLAAQCCFMAATIIFLGQNPGQQALLALCTVIIADLGMITLGSLLGAVSQGGSTKESLLSVILFPLLSPLLLAGIRLGAVCFGEALPPDFNSWLGMALAFDAIFLAAALVLFPHVYAADE